MRIESFIATLNADFFTGVPDSQLKPLCDYLMNTYGISKNHIIAANEGNCVGIAVGYHLATGKTPIVYMQNSGIGNAANPIISLLNNKVYDIPCIFIVGWRGEPNVQDEPQHIFQGEITVKLLENIGITPYIIDNQTTESNITEAMSLSKRIAFVVKKNAFEYDDKINYKNDKIMMREEILRQIVSYTGEDIIVSTTGKISRELFEIRDKNNLSHKYDFLTVGSMGHCSSIALGIALNKPDKKVWCIDGDGSALMHLGAMAVIGANKPKNFVHIVLNNEAHETVGGMPTVVSDINLCDIAKGCGYIQTFMAENFDDVDKITKIAKDSENLIFIEIKCSIDSRNDLGRPTISTIENKNDFMTFVS